jgi:predicted ATPase/DNA-binding SARP family transcriptional activator
MHVDIRLLGSFEVVVDGERVPDDAWRRRHAAALVKLLALHPSRRMLRDQVIDALWSDLDVDEAAPRLHKAAHYARSSLGVPEAVVLSGETVSLLPTAEVAVDVALFDRAADEAARSGSATALEAAVDLYRGALLPDDLYAPWTEEARESLRLRHVDLLRQAGRWDDVVAADPLDEEAHLRVVRQHLDQGDRRGALRRLEAMERVLAEELGVGPGETAARLREEAVALPLDDAVTAGIAGRATPLPLPPTQTIGREHDVALAVAMLERARILTLLGPGGVGKTRLAVEVALVYGEAAAVEATFVDLTKVGDAALVPELIVREAGIRSASGADPELLLQEMLRGRSMIFVLDNFEHVVDAAHIVGRIVQWSPDVRVLCTSRARLHVTGERIFDVSPLRVDAEAVSVPARSVRGGRERPGAGDAVTLFEQVATAVDPRFDLRPHLPDVMDICRTLDGLPLAIELAAGHVRTLSPSLLRTRLADRLGSPASAARDLPARQQTIPATIDWSLQLLGGTEQRLFAQLGVFASAVSLEAVEEVCAEVGGDVVSALANLVDQSLVRRVTTGPSAEPRFVLLELLRQRGRDLLVGDERDHVEERHARYFAGLLEHIDEHRWTDAAGRWIDDISDALTEIRAAHAWAQRHGDVQLAARITAALGTYWRSEGHYVEARRWVAEALPHEPDLDPYLAARLRLAAGIAEWPVDVLAARRHWTAAIASFRALGHDEYLSSSLGLAAVSYAGDGASFDLAMRLCDEAIVLAREAGEAPLLAEALNTKGELARVLGDDDLALTAYEEGRDLAASADDAHHLSFFLANLSFLADHRGDHEEARRLVCEALRLCLSLGRRLMAAWTISELAGPELGLGRPEQGARFLGAADQVLGTLGAARLPVDRSEHERVVNGLRSTLGEERFDQLYAEGAELPLEDAVALALHG